MYLFHHDESTVCGHVQQDVTFVVLECQRASGEGELLSYSYFSFGHSSVPFLLLFCRILNFALNFDIVYISTFF